jgi:hypothetical protein
MEFIQRIRRIGKRIRTIIKWIPILWYDEDWDFYYVYNILQKKLEFVEKDMLKSHLENSELYANKIKTAIRLIEIVKDEKYLDEVLIEDSLYDWNKVIEKHKKAKRVLFNYLNHNIESWWS